MFRSSRVKMLVAAPLLAGLMLGSSGCYGSFALTKKVHHWNGEPENKWVDELLFLVCVILPVYSISTFVDAIVLNTVEFWTGDNPMHDSADVREIKDGTQTARLEKLGDDRVKVTVSNEDGSQQQFDLVRSEAGIQAVDANGNVTHRVKDGALVPVQ